MRLNDCLTRHSCQWKFDNRNSLSVPTRNSGGTTAVKLGMPWLIKEDSTTGRYFCKPLRVYKGTQSAVAVNWSGGHSTRRLSALRIGSQWSVITSGRADLDATTQGTKQSEVSMSFLEGVVPASNPRRLHLTCWTQSLLEVKVSYLLGRMSSSVTPLGRTVSRGGVLLSSSSVAHFFGGDERGLLSSKGRFWFQAGSTLGVEAAWGISMGRSVSSSFDMTTTATSSESGPGRVWSRLIPPCSCSLFSSASTSVIYIWGTILLLRKGPSTSGLAGVPLRPHRPSSALEDTGSLGTSGLQGDEYC